MTKNAHIWRFGFEIFENQCQTWNQYLRKGYMRNFVKIWKLILFGPKCPNVWNFGSKFSRTNVRFEISTCKIRFRQNFVKRLESWNFFGPKYGHLGSKFEKKKLAENSMFPQFGNFGSLWLVLQLFWLVPVFSKNEK